MIVYIRNIKVEYEISENGCWEVISHNTLSYPSSTFDMKPCHLHRAMYMFNVLNVDSLDSKIMILHSCDNKKCINPEHLRQGTHEDNMKDVVARRRHKKRFKY